MNCLRIVQNLLLLIYSCFWTCTIPPSKDNVTIKITKPIKLSIACSYFDLKKGASHWSFGKLSGGTALFRNRENRRIVDSAFINGLERNFKVIASDSLKSLVSDFIDKNSGETNISKSLSRLDSLGISWLLFPYTTSEDSIGLTAMKTNHENREQELIVIEKKVEFKKCETFNRDCIFRITKIAAIAFSEELLMSIERNKTN